ncbi:MAG: hypothetical protein WEB88_02295 [Gemmatimonadota bacterium]
MRATRAATHLIQGRSNVSLASLPRPAAGAALLVLTLLVTACGRGPTAPVDTDTFVDAVAALRIAAVTAKTPEEYDLGRAEVLAELGVTEAELRAYVDAWADDPAHMARVWSAVRETLGERADRASDLELKEGLVPPEEGDLEPDAEPPGPGGDRAGPPGERELPRLPPGPGGDRAGPPGDRERPLPRLPPDTSAEAAGVRPAYSHSMVAGGFELTS